MKLKIINILVYFLLSLLFSCINSEKKQPVIETTDTLSSPAKSAYPKFEFTKELHKFGSVIQGEIVACDFFYKNTGSSSLIINKVETGCGCTAVNWSRHPLAPGKEDKITVEFNSSGRYGKQYKTITIFANTPKKVKELAITADVKHTNE